jgi:hypothetical protein
MAAISSLSGKAPPSATSGEDAGSGATSAASAVDLTLVFKDSKPFKALAADGDARDEFIRTLCRLYLISCNRPLDALDLAFDPNAADDDEGDGADDDNGAARDDDDEDAAGADDLLDDEDGVDDDEDGDFAGVERGNLGDLADRQRLGGRGVTFAAEGDRSEALAELSLQEQLDLVTAINDHAASLHDMMSAAVILREQIVDIDDANSGEILKAFHMQAEMMAQLDDIDRDLEQCVASGSIVLCVCSDGAALQAQCVARGV